MFGVRLFVAQNICLLYLSISSCNLMLCKIFFGENLEFLGKKLPPDVPRINPVKCACKYTLWMWLLWFIKSLFWFGISNVCIECSFNLSHIIHYHYSTVRESIVRWWGVISHCPKWLVYSLDNHGWWGMIFIQFPFSLHLDRFLFRRRVTSTVSKPKNQKHPNKVHLVLNSRKNGPQIWQTWYRKEVNSR